MKPDEMVIQSREEQNAILDKLLVLDLESVVDCGALLPIHWLLHLILVLPVIIFVN